MPPGYKSGVRDPWGGGRKGGVWLACGWRVAGGWLGGGWRVAGVWLGGGWRVAGWGLRGGGGVAEGWPGRIEPRPKSSLHTLYDTYT